MSGLSLHSSTPSSLANINFDDHANKLKAAAKNWQRVVNETTSLFKRVTGRSPSLEQRRAQAISAFKQYSDALTIETALCQTPDNQSAILVGMAQKFGTISENILSSPKKITNLENLKNHIKDANCQVQNGALDIREELVDKQLEHADTYNADNRPQYVVDDDGNIYVLQTALAITHLVISGGGGKGVALPAAIKVLEDHHLLDEVQKLTGSSVGALTSSLLACMPAQDVCDYLEKHPITDFIGDLKKGEFNTLYKNVKFKNASRLMTSLATKLTGHSSDKAAERAIQLIDQASSNAVQSYLESDQFKTDKESVEGQKLTSVELGRLKTLKGQVINALGDRTSLLLTFADFTLLNKIAPGKFKNLEITGFNMSTQKLEVFNVENTPDMPVALAARISMALPPVFKLVLADPKSEGANKLYGDGGLGANIHLGALDSKARQETAALIFDKEGFGVRQQQAKKNMFSHKEQIAIGIAGRLIGVKNLYGNKIRDNNGVHDLGPNALLIKHGEMKTLSLEAEKRDIDLATKDARVAMKEQILARKNQAVLLPYEGLEAIFKRLTEDQKSAIVLGGKPNVPEFRLQGEKETVESYAKSKAIFKKSTSIVHKLNYRLYQRCISDAGNGALENVSQENQPIPMIERPRSTPGSSSTPSSSNDRTHSGSVASSVIVKKSQASNPLPHTDETNTLPISPEPKVKITPLQYLSDLKSKLLKLMNGKQRSCEYLLEAKLTSHKNDKNFKNNVDDYVGKGTTDNDLLQQVKEIQALELLLLEANEIKRKDLKVVKYENIS
jgi:predicted acylesterase/phospholipase RssA